MRRSLTISLLAHAAILASAFIVLPNPKDFKVEEQESIPIDIVSIEDLGKRQATVKTPEKPVEKAAPKPVEVMKPVQPAPEVAPEITTAAKEASAPPEPKPEPKKDEPKKEEPKPEPKPKPEELAELIKKVDEPEPEKKQEEPKKAEVKPEKRPVEKPPEKKPEKKLKPKKDFNPDEISAFLNKTDEKRTAPLKPQDEVGTPKQGEFNLSGMDQSVAATLRDALSQHLYKCWDIPPGAREAAIQVKVHFLLNSDGTVSGAPEVVNGSSDPLFSTTAQSAVSAVMSCQAYDFLPQDKYDMWREITFTFNPNLMS
jgi:outer membrane biosynthesis protein TonB